MFVIRIVVAVLAPALLAGCAVGDTTRDSERIGGTGSVLGGTSTASSGSPTEQATDRALLRAGDLPDGYVTRRPAPDGVDDTTALRVHATADAGITVALISDVIAVRRGAAVASVTYTRFDARRDDLRLGPLVATVAARLAAKS